MIHPFILTHLALHRCCVVVLTSSSALPARGGGGKGRSSQIGEKIGSIYTSWDDGGGGGGGGKKREIIMDHIILSLEMS